MRASVLIIAAFLSVIAMPVDAARFSGDYLVQMCSNDENGNELVEGGHIACQAYIAGVMDYHNLMRTLDAPSGVDFCVPDQSAMYTLQNTVVRYMKKNRSQQGPFVAAPGVALGLYSKFPCKSKTSTVNAKQ